MYYVGLWRYCIYEIVLWEKVMWYVIRCPVFTAIIVKRYVLGMMIQHTCICIKTDS